MVHFVIANRKTYPFVVQSVHASKADAEEALPRDAWAEVPLYAVYAIQVEPAVLMEVMPASLDEQAGGAVLVVPVPGSGSARGSAHGPAGGKVGA